MQGFIQVTKKEDGGKLLLAIPIVLRAEELMHQTPPLVSLTIKNEGYSSPSYDVYIQESLEDVAKQITQAQQKD